MNNNFEINDHADSLKKLLSEKFLSDEQDPFHVVKSVDTVRECANFIRKRDDDFKSLDDICRFGPTCELGIFFENACDGKENDMKELTDPILFSNEFVVITTNCKTRYGEPQLIANGIELDNVYMTQKIPSFIEHKIVQDFEHDDKKYAEVNQLLINKMKLYTYDMQWNFISFDEKQKGSVEIVHAEKLDWFDVIITYDTITSILALNGAKICKVDDPNVYVEYHFDPIYQNHHIIVNPNHFYLFDIKMKCVYYKKFFSEDIVYSNRVDNSIFFALHHNDINRNFLLVNDIKDLDHVNNLDQDNLVQIANTTEHMPPSSLSRFIVSRPTYKIKEFMVHLNMLLFEYWEPAEISVNQRIKVEKYALYDLTTKKTYYFQMNITPYVIECTDST